MKLQTNYIFRTLAIFAFIVAFLSEANAGFYKNPFPASGKIFFSDTTRYPLEDRRGDPYSYPSHNSLDFSDTAFIKRNIQYDPKTKEYYITEKIGNEYYRTPVAFSMDDFIRMQGQKDEEDYFKKRASLLTDMNRRLFKPKFKTSNDWFNRIVGTGKVEIKPAGYVDLSAGYQGQNIQNPTLPERARKNGGFDFNMNSQLQVIGNIGDKLKLPINYNTLANFNFENQLKLDYKGRDDEILKSFQLGNINFASKGTLIKGEQSLFGVKAQLQFGKLFITSVLGNQRSQSQSLGLQGGSASQNFTLTADQYDENRHFLLAQYFRNNFNKAMKQLPLVNSQVQILRIEVWVTNRNGATTDTRQVVGLMDLGEGQPFGPWGGTGNPNSLPANNANNLYSLLTGPSGTRNSSLVQGFMTSHGLVQVQDFEVTYARKLQPSEYYFNPQIGFLSLSQPLQSNDVLGVAYQYTYNGRVYQVGEFSTDVPPDSTGTSQKVLYLKLLKATSQRTNLPIWGLMMKNVYSVGYGQLQRQDFTLNVIYDEPSLGQKNYLPTADVSDPYKGQPLLTLTNLDRLNSNNDPQPDGVFDFIEGFTVISSQSRIIFPVLEPFGHDLDYVYPTQALRDKYLFYPLYDTIKAIAQTYANLDRFKLVGHSKSAVVGDYQLGYNVPKGSVVVTAGGKVLQENIDYEINYDLGTLHIINSSVLASGIPVNVQFENQAVAGLQQRSFMGLRMEYVANKKLTLGGTVVRLSERPFFVKENYGEDPIRNTMFGFDVDYRNNLPRLTKLLNKLPNYSTKVMSTVTASAEAAVLKPGHAPQIGKGSSGAIYIDDFEGTVSPIDLRFPLISWALASIPQGDSLFPESSLTNNLASGFNRAKLAWYNIEPTLQEKGVANNPLGNNANELSKPETRQVLMQEIFPNSSTDLGQGIITTFDLAFYPQQKGPYNYESRVGRIDANGKLLNPKNSWGGIMRSLDQTDFETNNIGYIQFWLQDPFISNPTSQGGQLYFNLGNVSEDILPDGKRMYENGLPAPNFNAPVDTSTVWGQVPANPLQVTNAFSNNTSDRPYQDVGFDGLTDAQEKTKFSPYLNSLLTNFGAGSPVYQKAINDPSADNFTPYRDASYDQQNAGILQRYKDINNPQGNSPIANNNSQYISAFTQYPDAEDLNHDNTLNVDEEYFQYKVDLTPNMAVGTDFITDKRVATVSLANGTTRNETWYLFRIPIDQYQMKVGNIPDFKSIQFMRMFVTGFQDSMVVMRFAQLELERNQWRNFTFNIDSTGMYTNLPANDPTTFNTLAVNIEENDQRQPVRYAIPPGILRQQQLSNNNVQIFLNEQSLSLQICNLPKGQARGVFKTMNLDMRNYGRLLMFIHAESVQNAQPLLDGDIDAVIRIGSDFVGNYYEVKIPLKITPFGATDSTIIWPSVNNLDFDLSLLTALKTKRNSLGIPSSQYYSETVAGGRSYAIIGNPNLGQVQGILMSVENVKQEVACTEVWFDELRMDHLNEKGGWAALGRIDWKLADLGTFTVSGSAMSAGFGTLEQRINERSMQNIYTIDASANLDAGKLLPKKAGIQVPVYAGISHSSSSPLYDPFALDIKLQDRLKQATTKSAKDSIKNQALDATTIKTINFTNVRKVKTDGKRPKVWSVSNFDFNYSYIETLHHSPLLQSDLLRRTRGALIYDYSPKPEIVEPFKKMIRSRSPWLNLIKDFNFNYTPSHISFKADVFRQFGVTQQRDLGGDTIEIRIPPTYNKYFTFDRYYILQWNLTKSLALDYSAINNARIDEPDGRIDTKAKKDSVRRNFFKGGRTTQYHQEATLSYNVPTQKIPFLNWTTLRATYATKYDWLTASLLTKTLGNTLSNALTKTYTGELKFEDLYMKSKFLRRVYNMAPKQIQNNVPNNFGKGNKRDSSQKKQKQVKDVNSSGQIGAVPKFFFKLLTSLKRVSIQYTEDFGTILPGYMDSTKLLGTDLKTGEPGLGFIFGHQPDTNWINRFGAKGLLSRDSLVSALIQQRFNQRLNVTAQVSPVKDLTIDISLDKTFSKQYSELYKDTTGYSGLSRLNPYAVGSFNVSFISYQTLFTKFDPNVVSKTFTQFQNNRSVLSGKLALLNPYSGNTPNPNDPGYYVGYGRYAQDVIIPAFIAAYTNKNPLSVKLPQNGNPNMRFDPFAGILPKPNWTLTYNGLSKLPGLDKIFTNVTIRNAYHGSLSMNSFNTALLFEDPLRVGYPYFRDTLTGNFVPYFLIPNITIQEAFDPLIEIDMTFKNQMTTRFGFKKSRQLSLSLADYQLAENRSTEMTFGFNWRKKAVPIIRNIRIGKKGMKLDNDVTFKFDFSYRDDATANSQLDQKTSFGTGGQRVILIAPSIDYALNKRVNLTLYFQQNRSIPKISNAFPITNTSGGVKIRISLSQ